MLGGKLIVSEVILDNKILCPSMSSGTILMQTATATAGLPVLIHDTEFSSDVNS